MREFHLKHEVDHVETKNDSARSWYDPSLLLVLRFLGRP
jgi:hypothetical protein